MRLWGPAVLLLVLACDGARPYNVAVKNVSSGHIEDAHVSYGEYTSLTRELRPGDHTRQGPVPYPIPDRATVKWRTSDGVQHSREVDVKPTVPADFRGDLFFDIQDGGQVQLRTQGRR